MSRSLVILGLAVLVVLLVSQGVLAGECVSVSSGGSVSVGTSCLPRP